jgi:hypothetical protein
MKEPKSPLLKTCQSCGLQKPLTAFLQLSQEGTEYGNICADCRKKAAEKELKKERDKSGGQSGLKIDSKARLTIEKLHHDHIAETTLSKEEGRDKIRDEEKQLKQKQEKQEEQKKVTTSLFNKKNLVFNTPPPPPPPTNVAQQGQQPYRALTATERTLLQTVITLSQDGARHGTQLIFTMESLKYLIGLLRGSAPLAQAYAPFRNQRASTFAQPKTKEQASHTDALIDHIEKTWGPSSRKH